MANRSYIYGIKDNKHISIGESPYKIPYAYQVLAAYENSVIDSELFDKKVGIKANFNLGKKALYSLLDFLVATKEMKDHTDFVSEVEKTKLFLDEIEAEHILLENGEIYALYQNKEGQYLDGPGLERTNEFERQDSEWIGEDVANLEKFGIQPEKLFHLNDETLESLFESLLKLKDTWKENLGLDTWRSILYFQFNEA
ncbi:MAG: hypothetical protein V4622_03260 [Bacteroidota bacterium]